MRRNIAIVLLVLLVAWSTTALADGTLAVSERRNILGGDKRVVVIDWTADASDGSVPATALDSATMIFIQGYHLDAGETDPGATAPTDNYDITVTDEWGLDLFGGALLNRDTSATEIKRPVVDSVPLYGSAPIPGQLTVTISGNSVNAATGKLILHLSRP